MGSFLGVDVGGTKVAVRVESDGEAGTLEASTPWPAGGRREQDLRRLADLVAEVSRRAGAPPEGIGVAMPATVDAAGRVVTWPSRPSWVGLDLAAGLRAACGDIPVRWAGDGDLAAVAEARHAGCADLVYLGVGTGIGGGIVHGGRSLPGTARGSCELGHVVVDLDGAACACGRAGCVQAIASGPAVIRRAGQLRGAPVNAAALNAGWRRAEPWAVVALDGAAAALAVVVVSVGELLRPELALLGGGFAAAFEGFAQLVDQHARALARPGFAPPPVRPAAVGGLSSLRGAVELARDAARAGPAAGRP